MQVSARTHLCTCASVYVCLYAMYLNICLSIDVYVYAHMHVYLSTMRVDVLV